MRSEAFLANSVDNALNEHVSCSKEEIDISMLTRIVTNKQVEHSLRRSEAFLANYADNELNDHVSCSKEEIDISMLKMKHLQWKLIH